MRQLAEHMSRRRFLALAGVVVAGGAASIACGNGEDDKEGAVRLGDTPEASPKGEVHGVCFMPGSDGNPCKSFYQDLGEVEREGRDVIALYMFPADAPNPLDAGSNYRPERLQNNVFAGDGQFWNMLAVTSGSLNLVASTDGSREITSTRAGGVGQSRDLTRQPYLSEEEILRDAASGQIEVVDLGVVVDCPVTEPPPGATVVDLNPDVGEFCEPA